MTYATLDGNGNPVNLKSRTDTGEEVFAKDVERILGAASITVAPSIAVSNVETPIVAARATRRAVTLVHHGDGDTVFVKIDDGTAVTTANGFPLFNVAGYQLRLETTAAIAGIVAANGATVSAIEEHP